MCGDIDGFVGQNLPEGLRRLLVQPQLLPVHAQRHSNLNQICVFREQSFQQAIGFRHSARRRERDCAPVVFIVADAVLWIRAGFRRAGEAEPARYPKERRRAGTSLLGPSRFAGVRHLPSRLIQPLLPWPRITDCCVTRV